MNNKIKPISHRSFGFAPLNTSSQLSITAALDCRYPSNANYTFGYNCFSEARRRRSSRQPHIEPNVRREALRPLVVKCSDAGGRPALYANRTRKGPASAKAPSCLAASSASRISRASPIFARPGGNLKQHEGDRMPDLDCSRRLPDAPNLTHHRTARLASC